MFMRRSVFAVAAGLVAGAGAALLATRMLAGLLFGVKPKDPLTFTVTLVFFLAIASAAAYLPARNATRVDPMTALRAE